MLNTLHDWCKRWRVIINTNKSKTVHFRRGRTSRTDKEFRVGENILETEDTLVNQLIIEHLAPGLYHADAFGSCCMMWRSATNPMEADVCWERSRMNPVSSYAYYQEDNSGPCSELYLPPGPTITIIAPYHLTYIEHCDHPRELTKICVGRLGSFAVAVIAHKLYVSISIPLKHSPPYQAIIHLMETAGNLEPETLEVLIMRSLSERELHCWDFAANPSLVAEATAIENEFFVDWTTWTRGRHHSMGGAPGDMERFPSLPDLVVVTGMPIASGTHQTAVDGRELQAISSKTPMETTQPHPVPHNLPRDHRDVLTMLPKSLLYDERSNWFVFKGKFERYAMINGWSEVESADCLGWCLTGTVPYAELMQRMHERFGARELPATAQGRFHVAQQEEGESLDDWSDRALTLATAAFRNLPYAYAAEKAVTKFFHGLLDKEAGNHMQ
ncbi:hypothetical protein DPMN_153810 [Dreissena polymorpha]|uniref:Uncharacterized protein n=1 Tax=Dreissena polymorpha TaxID=45954 RepID=A0A9D4J557_DREPO|nr:hypothetical protein DPMN_153810 [Dreissena polymorpha]